MVVIRKTQQGFDIAFDLGDDRGKPVGAVADAQHRQADAGHGQHGFLNLLQHALRQDTGATGKIQAIEWIHRSFKGCAAQRRKR